MIVNKANSSRNVSLPHLALGSYRTVVDSHCGDSQVSCVRIDRHKLCHCFQESASLHIYCK